MTHAPKITTPGREPQVVFHPCFAARLGSVSGGKDTQRWRDSSHTPMIGAGEIWIGEVADGNGDVSGKTFTLPVNGGSACWTEMKGQRVAAFGRSHPRGGLTGEGDLLAASA